MQCSNHNCSSLPRIGIKCIVVHCMKSTIKFANSSLHTLLLNTTMVAFKVLPLGSYAPIPAPSSPFKTILELVGARARSGEKAGCSNTVICLVAKKSFTDSAV